MVGSRKIGLVAAFLSTLLVQLLCSDVVFSSEKECVDLFFKPYSQTQIDFDSLVPKIQKQEGSFFDKFKKFSDLTGSSVYIGKTSSDESSNLSDQFINKVYGPSKSVVGLRSVVGGSFNLDESSILNKIEELRKIKLGELYTKEFYEALTTIRNYDQELYQYLITSLKEFIEWDPVGLTRYNWVKEDADRKLGIDDPTMNRLAFFMSRNPMVINGMVIISRRILEAESRADYPVKNIHEFSKMNTSLSWILTYLYYNYFADSYESLDCSGVVLSHNVVLTAGKCLYNAKQVKYIHNGKEYQSIRHETNPRYVYDSDSNRLKDTLKDFPSRSNIGIAVFEDGTFFDIPPAVISFKELQDGTELISSGVRLEEGISKITLLKGVTLGSEMFTVENPNPKEVSIGYGEIGGGLFNTEDKLVGSISTFFLSEMDETTFNLYTTSFGESNREYLKDVASRFKDVKIEE